MENCREREGGRAIIIVIAIVKSRKMGRATIKRQQQQQLEKVSATETVFMGGSGWRRRMINARFGVRRMGKRIDN